MHQMGYVEDHGAGIAILEAFPIDIKPHAQVLRVGNLIGRHPPGAYWAEGIAAFTLVPGAAALYLVFAFRYVVDPALASHIVQRSLFFYIPTSEAHPPQLHYLI